jgi:hypothetical protein
VASHRSKSVVERNLPRWFRKASFKAWDDFTAFFKQGGTGEDTTLKADWDELDQKGDEAPPKALGRLIKAYNKGRRFSKTEVAPPWFFVESLPAGRTLPSDEAWTIDLANELDHERSQRPASPRPERKREKTPAGETTPDAPPAEEPPEPQVAGVVPPPASDKTWIEALRRLPGAIQLLVDGRGKNTSELNERRRRALELAQLDRFHNLAAKGAELRKQILTWALEKKPSADEIAAELKKHAEQVDDWIKMQVEAAREKVAGFDEHVREELRARLRKVYPKVPDESALARLAKQALDAARPKRLGNWARKVIDDFNNSRGSAAEKVRDPRLVDGLIRWLTTKREQDTPTDGEIYDQIQRLGGPNMAAKKRRQEGPRPPKQQERKSQRELEAEAEERAALAEARAAEQKKRAPRVAPDAAVETRTTSEAPPPPAPPDSAAEPVPPSAEAPAS